MLSELLFYFWHVHIVHIAWIYPPHPILVQVISWQHCLQALHWCGGGEGGCILYEIGDSYIILLITIDK